MQNFINFKALSDHIYDQRIECENLSLGLSKLIKREIIEETKKKPEFLNVIKRVTKILTDFKQRTFSQIQSFKNQGYINLFENDCLKLKTASRLVVGLGGEHALETSLTLHHIFGIPYIPSTALKGVVRMVSFWEIAQRLNKKTEEELDKLQEQLYDNEISNNEDEEILKHKLLFGTQGFKGLLLFLDAFPVIHENMEVFELDVMTPHYSNYYTRGDVPGDWENPTPITFLTVKEGIEFCFYGLLDKYRLDQIKNSKDVPEKISKLSPDGLSSDVKRWLSIALEEFGVGAKTRLGYGAFASPAQD